MAHYVLILLSVLCIVAGSVQSAAMTDADDASIPSYFLPFIPVAFSMVLVAQRYLMTDLVKLVFESVWPVVVCALLCSHVHSVVKRGGWRTFALDVLIIAIFVWQRFSEHWVANNAVLLLGTFLVIGSVSIESEQGKEQTTFG